MTLKHLKATVTWAAALACAALMTQRVSAQTVEPEDVLDLTAGGGWILATTNNVRANFGLAAGVATNSVATNTFLFGAVNYVDRASGVHVQSTEITAYTVVDDQTREIAFDVTIDGAPGTATIVVSDQGEPGRNDTFEITLSSGYTAGGVLGGGNRCGGNLQVNPPLD